MRVMVIVKASQASEAGVMPDGELLAEMGRFNEELVKAGVMLAGEGLHPSRKGVAGALLGRATHRHRRALCRDQGAGGRLLAVAGAIDGRSHRVGAALPEPARGGLRDRDPPRLRGRGLRRRARRPSCASRRSACARRRRSPAHEPHASRRMAVTCTDASMPSGASRRPRIIGGLARMVRDVGLAEDLAQDALVAALEHWPARRHPGQPGGVADGDRQEPRARPAAPGSAAPAQAAGTGRRRRRRGDHVAPDFNDALDDATHRRRPAAPDVHRLPPGAVRGGAGRADPAPAGRADDRPRSRARSSCPNRRSRSASCAPSARCRRARVPFEVPRGEALATRLASVLEVIYLIFNEGYAATAGERLDAAGAVRRSAAPGPRAGRADADEAEVQGLVALMEIQASRTARPHRRGRAADPAAAIRIAAAGIACSSAAAWRRWTRPASPMRSAPSAAPTRCKPPLRPVTRAPAPRTRPTGRRSWRCTTRWRCASLAGGRAQPRGRRRHGLRRRRRRCRWSMSWRRSRRCSAITCCTPCVAICSKSSGAWTRRARRCNMPPS